MRYLTDRDGAREIDRHTIRDFGLSSLILMERAALACAGVLAENIRPGGRIFVLAGTGNNGADGLACARILLQRGYEVSVLAAGEETHTTEEWRFQRDLAGKLGISVAFAGHAVQIPCGYDAYVDALFGIGLSRPVSGIRLEALESFMHASEGAFVLAVDIPSGIDASRGTVYGKAVRADVTVTFGPEKAGLLLYPGAMYCGRVIAAEIGFHIPDPAEYACSRICERADIAALLPGRPADGNKGSFGSVLVIAGAAGMAGAACFAAEAALRMGAGLVRVLTAPENAPVLQIRLPEAVLVTRRPEESLHETIAREMRRASCVVIGPGLSMSGEAAKALDAVCSADSRIPVVVDADGLNLLAGKLSMLQAPERFILTPHPGELARLLTTTVGALKEEGLISASGRLYEQSGAVCVCKDARTVIRTGRKQVFLNPTGNDGMASGGSGDVLSGVIGGLLAAGCAPADAAVAGVWIHGAAGDAAALKEGRHFMSARSIIAGLSAVLSGFENRKILEE